MVTAPWGQDTSNSSTQRSTSLRYQSGLVLTTPRPSPDTTKPLDYNEYLRGPYWEKLRAEKLAEKSACEDCGTRQYLNLHHRYCYNSGKSVLYHERDYPDVLKVLCYPCHMKKHGDSAIS